MHKSIKQTSKRLIIVPIVAVGLMTVLAFTLVDTANARGTASKNNLAEAIAQNFNLEQDKVAEVMQNFHQQESEERQQKMQEQVAEQLEIAVQRGRLTEAQMYAILEKHDEMHERMSELHEQDLSRDDLHELRMDIHDEMEAWAEENGIDFDIFMRVGKRMARQGGMRML